MKRIVSISLGSSRRNYQGTTTLLGQAIDLQRIGTDGDVETAASLIDRYDGQVDAFALGEPAAMVRVGKAAYPHRALMRLAGRARHTPVVDGSRILATLGRWMVQRTAECIPDVFQGRRILFLSGVECYPLAQALEAYQPVMRFADPLLSGWGGGLALHSLRQLEHYAATVLPLLTLLPAHALDRALLPPPTRTTRNWRLDGLFQWAEVIVGRCGVLLATAPDDLSGRTVLTDDPSPGEIEALRQRGVATLVTLTPPLSEHRPFVGADVLEALVTVVQGRDGPPGEDDLLRVMMLAGWEPTIQHLTAPPLKPTFAFVIHPITPSDIFHASFMHFARYLPQRLVEWASAFAPPIYLSRMRGIRSLATGKEIEGVLLTLGSTPREIMRRPPEFTYRRLIQAARISERLGVKIMGLGAFTSVVGDGGVTVAQHSRIGITTGNALTVAVTLELMQDAVQAMGGKLEQSRVVIVGATGSIGAACARMLASTAHDVVLVAPRPERLLALQQQIGQETASARVAVATRADAYLDTADVILLATSAFNGQVIDLRRLQPGAVVCDVSRPANVSRSEAAQRADVLFIETGTMHLPGQLDVGFNINLPPGSAYACLAETALLALEGRFEDYTLGRVIEPERVQEMHRLMHKHGLRTAGLRSFGRPLTEADIAEKRGLAAARRQMDRRDAGREQSASQREQRVVLPLT